MSHKYNMIINQFTCLRASAASAAAAARGIDW
jgi:hypothetical protein